MPRKTAYTPFVFLLLALISSLAGATTIILPTDAELVDWTPLVIEGRVLSSAPVDLQGAIWTETAVAVERALKGSATGTIVIREIGGILGDRASIVFGSPEYQSGESVLLFLSPAADGTWRTRDLAIGKFVETWRDGRRIWHRDEDLPGTRIIDDATTSAEPRQRDATRFEEFIESRGLGRTPAEDYLIEASPSSESGATEGVVSSNFSLLSEPSIYRWQIFEKGSAISWRSSGAQEGYAGGGLSELKAALAAWTGYGGANIRMSYDGTAASISGLAKPNAIHEVLFNDPLGEIEGSWTGSSGVVGRGGFNAARKGALWTSPFAADATHTQKTWETWEILEGNLVIQDGVSPARGISSTRLAEIIAHEFGHTLGMGHSQDATALMYATLSNGGPSLRADDQTAARWLYPAAGASPAPSPAPAPAPTASFSFTPANPSTQTMIAFTDASAGSPTAWQWTFGDGTSSSQRNPSKRYSLAGTYVVTLTATNASGSSQAARSVVVAPVAPAYPAVSASFDANPSTGTVDQAVTFVDRSSGAPTAWSWSFGDGATSTAQSPAHIYRTAGTYDVRLTASNGGGSSTVVRAFTVSVNNSVSRALIAASAEAPGVGGSEWRTELALFNDGESPLTIDFTYIPGAGGTLLYRQTYLAAGRSITYASALRDLFGLASATGAIAIDARASWGAAALKISSRTFTIGQAGTYGQFVPGEELDAGATTLFLTGVESTPAFRTNVGIVNTSPSWRQVRLTLLDANGQTLAIRDETVAPRSFQQQSILTMFPAMTGQSREGMSLRVTADGSGIRSYASVVDNVSHDPVFVTAAAPAADRDLTVPAIGRTAGAAGTWWRSDVSIFNPHGSAMTLALRYLPSGSDNRWAGSRPVSIPAGRTVVLRDVLSWFGISSGTGALRITWSGTAAGPIVTTRTYTTRPDGGTLGQSMDAIQESQFAPRAAVVGSKSDGGYRTNIGLVNGDDAAATAWVTVTSPAGALLGRAPVALEARSQAQLSLAALFPHLSGTIGDFVVRADGGSKLFLYTSVVDNVSGDPLYIAGK